MKRRRQCPAIPAGFANGLRCQLVLGHEGFHKASHSEESSAHFAWGYSAIGIFEYHVLPGTVRFRQPRARVAKAARLAGEWTALLGATLAVWLCSSLGAAVVFLGLRVLMDVRRPHFIDVGRFTAGVWPASPAAPPLIFGIGWARHGEGRDAKKAGFEVIIGGVVVGVFSLVPRSEWPAYKRAQAAFHATKRKGRRS